MLTILVSIIGFGILSKILEDEFGPGLFWGVIIGLIVAFALPAETKIETHTTYLVSLSDGMGVEGQFFLGSGTVNSEWRYSYYVKEGNAYYLESIRAQGTPIVYTNDRPRIEWDVETMITPIKGRNLWAIDSDTQYQKIIYVPKGSIKQNYNLDAQ